MGSVPAGATDLAHLHCGPSLSFSWRMGSPSGALKDKLEKSMQGRRSNLPLAASRSLGSESGILPKGVQGLP